MGTVQVYGVTFVLDSALPTLALNVMDSWCWIDNCRFEVLASHADTALMASGRNGLIGGNGAYVATNGNGHTVGYYISAQVGGHYSAGASPIETCNHSISNLAFARAAYFAANLSTLLMGNSSMSPAGTSGASYGVHYNAIMQTQGQPLPGNGTGSVSSGGQFAR
jgi:hypothetical protein